VGSLGGREVRSKKSLAELRLGVLSCGSYYKVSQARLPEPAWKFNKLGKKEREGTARVTSMEETLVEKRENPLA